LTAILQATDSGDVYFASAISARHAAASEIPTNKIVTQYGHMFITYLHVS